MKHHMRIEQVKERALMTAQGCNYSCMMDVPVAFAKLKARWPGACTCNVPFSTTTEVHISVSNSGRKLKNDAKMRLFDLQLV